MMIVIMNKINRFCTTIFDFGRIRKAYSIFEAKLKNFQIDMIARLCVKLNFLIGLMKKFKINHFLNFETNFVWEEMPAASWQAHF